MRFAIDKIISKLKITSPNPREETYYYSVTLEGSDYPLVAQTLNIIADLFVESNITMQKKFIKETIVELERQLAAAEQQQTQSKNELRSFLAQNPGAGLSQSTQQTMTELISLESGTYESKNLIDELQNLKEKFNNSPKDEQLQVVNEMIVFLQTHGSLAAPALQANLAQYTQEAATAQQNYAKTHPIFAEIEGKFASLNSRTIQAVDSYIAQLKKTSADRNYSIQKITSKLQGLPSQELKFAELQKREGIDSDIYSKLLAKYNEVKVSETVRGADVFIMEYAIQPIAPSRMLQYAKSAGIVLVAFLFFAFGPAVGLDFFDKTARTEQTLTKMLPYRFLETIPLIKMPEQKNLLPNNNRGVAVQVREILINQPGIHPPSAIELFRSLATKVLLEYYEVPDKSFIVTSFEMDEGKSTVAANLAISLAEHGVKTVLIDCDLRRGVSHKILSLNKSPGLSEYLIHVSTSAQPSSIPLPLQQTSFANLWAIPSGSVDENPQRLLGSPALASLKQRLLNESFVIIFDSPPVAVAADSAILSNLAYKYLIVVRAGRTNVVNLRKILKKDYPMIDKKVLGVVLNMGENNIPTRYYSYYYNKNLKRPRSDT
jgi:capsular exopolysaccharide synthesis family protein